MTESRDTPLVRPAKADPPPTAITKSLWITRKVRVAKILSTSATTAVTVDDVKAQSTTGPFKVQKVSAWVPGRLGAQFQLSEGVWNNDTALAMQYTDIAPPGRMPGVMFNIPDQLATVLNTGTASIVSVIPISTDSTVGGLLVADVTIRYQM